MEPKKRTRADNEACFEEREGRVGGGSGATFNTAAGKVMDCFVGLPNSSQRSGVFLSHGQGALLLPWELLCSVEPRNSGDCALQAK